MNLPSKALALFAAFSLVFASGCLVGSETKTTIRGQYISQENFNKIQTGSTANQVLESFGEPTTRVIDGDNETWRYKFTQAKTSKGAVLFLFVHSNETEHEGTVTVQLVDATVTKVTRN